MPFSHESVVRCYETNDINVIYTNQATSVDAWIDKVEGILGAIKRKIVRVDVEYTRKGFHPQEVAVLQFCVGKECLVYHACNADEPSTKLHPFLHNWRYWFAAFDTTNDIKVMARSGMFITPCCHKDIQTIWRDPDNEKPRCRKQGLKDVAAAIIDPYYENMKDGFGEEEHKIWADASLPPKHLEYAARDAYAAYEIYRRLDVFERGFLSLYKNPEKKRARYW
ncbi:unnamed protein product [Alopecurus aequalis]